jgi:hypothetical protein
VCVCVCVRARACVRASPVQSEHLFVLVWCNHQGLHVHGNFTKTHHIVQKLIETQTRTMNYLTQTQQLLLQCKISVTLFSVSLKHVMVNMGDLTSSNISYL